MTCKNCGNEVPELMKFCPKCGTPLAVMPYSPPAATPYSPPVAQPQTSWGASPQFAPPKPKSRVGKILLIVGIVLVLLASGIGVAIYFGVRHYVRSTKSSETYALAESTLKESRRVKERFGEISKIGFPFGTYKEEPDGTGFAVYTMAVEGEKATGQYVIGMDKKNGKWRVLNAIVTLPNGEEVKVLDPTVRIGIEPPDEDETGANDNENSNTENSNTSKQKSNTISGGVLNGKATSLPQPAYPAAAKAARASGQVVVQVTVDEEGKVISAKAVSGHPLLQASAVAAARLARFPPKFLSGEPVKVMGLINYNFELEQ